MKFLKSGISFGSIGRTSLPKIRRRLASPEAETASYCPVRINVTILSEDPPYLARTLQPLALVKGFTHCGWVYASHAIRLTAPSPFPLPGIAEGPPVLAPAPAA